MQRALAKDPDARFATAHELVAALRAAAGTVAGAAVEPARAPRRISSTARSAVATLGVCVAGAVIGSSPRGSAARDRRSHPSRSKTGTVAIEVTSTPDGAIVQLAGKPQGTTPRTLHLAAERARRSRRREARLPAEPSHVRRRHAPTPSSRVNLGAVTRFEGVWKLPTGELRALERNGDRVAISKLKSVTGHRELYKFYPFVAADAGIAFAADDEVIDPRAPDDKSCHVAVHVEYRYDAARDVLELRRPKVTIDFVGGQCVPRSRGRDTAGARRGSMVHTTACRSMRPAGTPIKATKPTSTVKSSRRPRRCRRSRRRLRRRPRRPRRMPRRSCRSIRAARPTRSRRRTRRRAPIRRTPVSRSITSRPTTPRRSRSCRHRRRLRRPWSCPQQGKSTKQLDLGDDDLTPHTSADQRRDARSGRRSDRNPRLLRSRCRGC